MHRGSLDGEKKRNVVVVKRSGASLPIKPRNEIIGRDATREKGEEEKKRKKKGKKKKEKKEKKKRMTE